MEVEVYGSLTFLDVLLSIMEVVSIGFSLKNYTDQYIYASSHHFLVQKIKVLNMLATRAIRIYDDNHLEDAKSHLLIFFEYNGYRKHQGLRAFQRASKGHRIKETLDKHITNVQLPFIHGTTDTIAHSPKNNKVSSTFKPLNTIRSSLRSVKDLVNPKDMKGVYSIPCSSGHPYFGEIERSIN